MIRLSPTLGSSTGFSLGEETNTFDAGVGSKTDAEVLRDTYGVANPSWLSFYDTDSAYNIILLYVDGNGDSVGLYQNRISGVWVDNTSAIGVRGLQGSEGINYNKLIPVNSLTDFPTAVGGVITLEPSAEYVLGDDLDIGTNRFLFNDRSVLKGIESLNIKLTYTGTDPLFSGVDATTRVSNLELDCLNAPLFDWSSTTRHQLRVTDVQCSCHSLGSFSGVDSFLRFTNFSPEMTTNGMSLSGSWASLLYDTSWASIAAGTMFDLGTSIFDSYLCTQLYIELPVGTTLISGASASGNLSSEGLARFRSNQVAGEGTILENVTVDDAKWEFFGNNKVQDTRPDALLSLQDNAVNTVITTAGVAVPVSGVWVGERSSQFTTTNQGRATYNGVKDVTMPLTAKLSIAPTVGQNKIMAGYIAINGVVVSASKATSLTGVGDPTSITVIWQDVLSAGDYVEVFAANATDTSDVLVSSATLRLN